MKLAIIFEVPDGGDAYADAVARMIQHHAFAKEQGIKHWSFDLEMRPIAGALIPDGVLTDQVEAAGTLATLLVQAETVIQAEAA
jgi:hypothetical protein